MQTDFQFADHAAEMDALVNGVLGGRISPGWPLSDGARLVLRELRNARGAGQAKQISELTHVCHMKEREVKEAVREIVVDFQVPIVGSRRPPYGYYLPVTPAERIQAATTLKHEIRALASRVRALEGKHSLREFLGQMQIEEAS
jgi:hypothetical protein